MQNYGLEKCYLIMNLFQLYLVNIFLKSLTPSARVAAILGPFDKEMLKSARYAHKYFTKNCALYEKREGEPGYTYLRSKRTTIKNRLKSDDPVFVDFISKLLTVNPAKR